MLVRKALTVKEIQQLDRAAIEGCAIPALILMENAGRAVSQEVIGLLKKLGKPDDAIVSIICGAGNNGGDGFVAARHLAEAGIMGKVFLLANPQNLKADALINYQILRKLKVPIKLISRIDKDVQKALVKSIVIVDALFGVGLNREIKEPFKSAIHALNTIKRPVISIDIPSGLDGTTGHTFGVCVRAFKTVTFSAIKKGFLKNQGPCHVGKVIVADIGIPKKLFS